jgi:hypothetical protein
MATKTAASGAWGTAGTWTPSGVPGSGDDVVIPAAVAITSCPTVTLASLSVAATGSVALLAGGTTLTVGSLTNAGTISGGDGTLVFTSSINNTGTLGPVTITSGTGSTTTIQGTFPSLAVNGGTSTASGDVTITNTLALHETGAFGNGVYALAAHNINSGFGGTLNLGTGTFTLTGTMTKNNSEPFVINFIGATATVIATADFKANAANVNLGSCAITLTGVLDGTGFIIVTGAAATIIGGTVTGCDFGTGPVKLFGVTDGGGNSGTYLTFPPTTALEAQVCRQNEEGNA